MKAGSMQGLIGANVNMKLTRTPMRVFKEAELKGDTETMKRAMGYVEDFQEKAHECSDKAQNEIGKELKEERREQDIRREQAIERKEDAEEYTEKIRKNNKLHQTDSVEISEEGKIVLKNNLQTEETTPIVESTDVKLYTSEGKQKTIEPEAESVDKKMDVTV